MPGLRPDVDPDGLLEYSVVYSDRALNHMSQAFQQVMRDLSRMLKDTYRGHSLAVIPGSGTFGMEAVARQFATGRSCLVIQNGWFSYRWSQILQMGGIPSDLQVLKARPVQAEAKAPFAPAPQDEVLEAIRTRRPDLVFAPHVETAAGMRLPDDYLAAIADAVHDYGGLFVLDCIASGTLWVDMTEIGVDLLVSAPQKGWSGTPCCGLVLLSERARERIDATTSTSFACDLKKWLEIMETYEQGGHAYHATLPTDGLRVLQQTMRETLDLGREVAQSRLEALGARVRSALELRGWPSVAAPGFQAPGVVVSYTDDPALKNGSRFAAAGVQIAGGVPLMCDEPSDFSTFRIGLFGLDKLADVDGAVLRLEQVLDQMV